MDASFTKYHGCGNDFIIIDDHNLQFTINRALIAHLCHRNFGIGADGLILLQPAQCSDGMMRIFNADGNEATMCGNGLRCAAHFLSTLIGNRSTITIRSLAKRHDCYIAGSRVTATLGALNQPPVDLNIQVEDQSLSCCYLDTGVPHLVVFVDAFPRAQNKHGEKCGLDSFFSWAKILRHHPHFAPAGVNVNFAKQLAPQTWQIRTYERGVEAETMACGTGAAAVAVAAWHRNPTLTHFTIHCLSKHILEFALFPTNLLPAESQVFPKKSGNANRKKLDHQVLHELQMTGAVCPVFQGSLLPKL
ncbi:MAG: diaminopimelate epimerase [Chlamydiota bacterium]